MFKLNWNNFTGILKKKVQTFGNIDYEKKY